MRFLPKHSFVGSETKSKIMSQSLNAMRQMMLQKLLTMTFGFIIQIFPIWQNKTVLAINDFSEPFFQRNQNVSGVQTENDKGDQTLAKVKKAI